MKNLLLAIAILTSFLAGSTRVEAARRKVIRTESIITAVSPASITVKLGSHHRTFRITGNTEIHLDGTKVGAGKLRRGMHAEVTVSQLDPVAARAVEASRR